MGSRALPVVLALAACAVLARATSPPAIGEWIADAPAHVLEQGGVRPDPLLPKWVLPAETTVRRLPARIGGDALDLAAGRSRTLFGPHADPACPPPGAP